MVPLHVFRGIPAYIKGIPIISLSGKTLDTGSGTRSCLKLYYQHKIAVWEDVVVLKALIFNYVHFERVWWS